MIVILSLTIAFLVVVVVLLALAVRMEIRFSRAMAECAREAHDGWQDTLECWKMDNEAARIFAVSVRDYLTRLFPGHKF